MLAQEGRRCGVYVLEFDDGTRYVGQARDVVRRYADHRRGHSRAGRTIRAVEFTEVAAEDLNRVEQKMIAHEGLRGPIRNNRYAATMAGPSLLDPVIAVDDQWAWLNSIVPEGWNDAGPRADDPEQRVKGLEHCKQLLAHPLGETACWVMRDYIAKTVPRPRKTERRFWAVSALPSTLGGRLTTLCVGKMETMFLYAESDGEHKGASLRIGGSINVTGSLLAPDVLGGDLDTEATFVDRGGSPYESSGADLATMRFRGRAGYAELLSWPGVVDAARDLAVRLMRKGPTLQGRWHNYPFADILLGDVAWPWISPD